MFSANTILPHGSGNKTSFISFFYKKTPPGKPGGADLSSVIDKS
jgi:hypothetical protein